MSQKYNIGGDRLGSGNKMNVDLKTYNRSTHDLNTIVRTTASAGTLIPFISKVMLPTDVYDINLDVDVMTHPTIGPLFGSYKIQLDLFTIPVRLYQPRLHMNMLNVGLEMSQIKLPQVEIEADVDNVRHRDIDNEQINPSSLLRYLGYAGIGKDINPEPEERSRMFNAVPILAYWDIYKNYYANQQEEYGAVIHVDMTGVENILIINILVDGEPVQTIQKYPQTLKLIQLRADQEATIDIVLVNKDKGLDVSQLYVRYGEEEGDRWAIEKYWGNWTELNEGQVLRGTLLSRPVRDIQLNSEGWELDINETVEPNVAMFPLTNIDEMKIDILSQIKDTSPFVVNRDSIAPYSLILKQTDIVGRAPKWCKQYNQEGLALKTYQSDMFNNYVRTEWIDGSNGINEISAVDVSDGLLKIDALVLARKVYDMLNRIAISGGSYYDWMDVNWKKDSRRPIETPIYEGGLIKELVFQQVISNSAAADEGTQQPLGTLAGRGVMGGKHKGGKAIIKTEEISYLMGIFSLTPRVDYSQGNQWDVNLENMDQFHKPALDEIGFQDLITEQQAWWDTRINVDGSLEFKSAGKQPAWIHYQTDINRTYGNFAKEADQMFMTLNRRYEAGVTNVGEDQVIVIEDQTTYIDPKKFNYIFADTRRDAQNFWVQIAVDIEARRTMSARIMPNL